MSQGTYCSNCNSYSATIGILNTKVKELETKLALETEERSKCQEAIRKYVEALLMKNTELAGQATKEMVDLIWPTMVKEAPTCNSTT
jgi:hypothetical protein